MKKLPIFFAAAIACGAVLAQAPAGTTRPANQLDPNASGGKAQANAAVKNDARTGGNSASAGTTANQTMTMDVNGDGMISRQEWDTYHGKTWSTMKPNKQGMVPWADVQAGMGGQGGTPK
ncbi:hypothetical protein WG902_19325 [Ramlibacter sp. PS3R-8]|uniref:hypothetical protein n=1 Tax=Ramlibacter sp. PS3R-8 TaxID=3133437 RepID=UPI0030A470FA